MYLFQINTSITFIYPNFINHKYCIEIKQGLIATQLSVLEALVLKVDENIHPCYFVAENIHPWLLQKMCTVDSVQCSVGILQEPDRREQILCQPFGN